MLELDIYCTHYAYIVIRYQLELERRKEAENVLKSYILDTVHGQWRLSTDRGRLAGKAVKDS